MSSFSMNICLCVYVSLSLYIYMSMYEHGEFQYGGTRSIRPTWSTRLRFRTRRRRSSCCRPAAPLNIGSNTLNSNIC